MLLCSHAQRWQQGMHWMKHQMHNRCHSWLIASTMIFMTIMIMFIMIIMICIITIVVLMIIITIIAMVTIITFTHHNHHLQHQHRPHPSMFRVYFHKRDAIMQSEGRGVT